MINDENVTNLDEDEYFVQLMTLSGMTVTTSDDKFMITMSDKKLTNKESEQHQLKVRTKQISLHQCVYVETMKVMLCQPLCLFCLDFSV